MKTFLEVIDEILTEEKSQLEMGIEVEKEHADAYEIIKDYFESDGKTFPLTLEEFSELIAKAHIEEIDDYYDRLKEMEDEAILSN